MGPIGRRIAGFTAGAVMGTALFAAPLPAEEPSRPSRSALGAELLQRWERWRRAPVAFREVSVRSAGDRTHREEVVVGQRFPDRLVRDGGSVSARIGGRSVGCVDAPVVRCDDAGRFDAAAALAAELDDLARATTGHDPSYRLSDLGRGCFRLRLVRHDLRPAFGSRTDLCFDEATGVVHREVSVVDGITLTVRRTDITEVRDSDLALPAPPT